MEQVDNLKPTLQQVLLILGIPEEEVLCLYQTGSRVYGTANPDADWDFVMVVTTDYKKKSQIHIDLIEKVPTCHYVPTSYGIVFRCHVPAPRTGIDQFHTMVEEHHHVAVYCLCTPPQYIWKEEVHFTCQLNLSRLKVSFIRKVGACFTRARTVYHKKGDYLKMKKMIVHALRYLLVARQIVTEMKFHPVDFSVANQYYSEITKMDTADWKYYEERYWPLKESLVAEIFPPSIPMDDFLERKEDVSLPVAQLRRAQKFPAYQGQEKVNLLDIIRHSLLSDDEIETQFPEYSELYFAIKKDYNWLCESIQQTYDAIKKSCGEDWSDSEASAKCIHENGGKWKTVLFFMKQNHINFVRELFITEEKTKYLYKAIFHSKKNKIGKRLEK